jgi:flavin-dependent dehydrogenase
VGTPRSEVYDTVVAGAGPAGIMAAYEASRQGSVLLLDSSRLPRDKSCGGMLHGVSQRFLERFGPIPEDIVLRPRHVHFRWHDWDREVRKVTSLRFLNVDRPGFDDWLLKTVLPPEVEVVGACPVSSFVQDATGVTVTLGQTGSPTSVRCDNLIGADGARSTVRRALLPSSAGTYVTLQDYVRLDGEIEPYFDCVFMRDVGDRFAYAYVVPKGDVAIVGSVFYPKSKRPWEAQNQAIDILRTRIPQLGESVKREAHSALYIRATGDTVRGVGRVLLAGEAGGFISPTSGEGISYALDTGSRAGIAVARNEPQDALAAYERATADIVRDIHRRLRWLPVMESPVGKYVAGLTPTKVVDVVTQGL